MDKTAARTCAIASVSVPWLSAAAPAAKQPLHIKKKLFFPLTAAPSFDDFDKRQLHRLAVL